MDKIAKQERIKREQSDYIDILKEQVEFMVEACEKYDNGKFNASKQLATYIRTLVNQTRASTSLLTHLDMQNKMKFYNTSFLPKNAVYFLSMVFMCVIRTKDKSTNKIISEPIFLPIFKPKKYLGNRWMGFDEWWNKKIIVSDHLTFTRFEMIWFMANQDGGTHVDEGVVEKYYKISKATESMFYLTNKPIDQDPYQKGIPYKYLHFAIVRQIAHELIFSLIREFNLNVKYKPTNQVNLQNAVSISRDVDNFCVVKGSSIEYE
ncbi:hypothetical protein NC661_06470 [Aquibacillus koreensis]|uniref:Uncharacterized protein n=1 Tax=Aquibacillus koreensis TaxID=279446 RepID=A0A9X4AHI8_9BACI|nr:hypothetical protein [Aquibacillus koreensis]MCT2535704.1 hypothetical protein [Aquibacillus koreensis]MDC3420011.1 hypothetical protein [Aquibacillus koreensis]